MADIKKNVTLRLTLEGGNVVGAELDGLGKKGEGAGKRVAGGFGEASAALRAFAPLVGGLSAGALAMMTKSAIDSVGALGEQAEQLGLSARAWQVYQFAATQAGVKQEQLETSISIFTAKMGQAAEGNTEAVRSFEKLGVGVLGANGKVRAADEVIADVAESLSKMSDSAIRGAAAKDLFGKSGQKLLPILSQGRDGLAKFDEELVRSGRLLDEAAIRKADEAADKIAALEHNVTRLGQSLAITLVPGVNAGTDALTKLVDSADPLLKFLGRVMDMQGRQFGLAVNGNGVLEAAARNKRLAAEIEAADSSDRARGARFPSAPVAGRNPQTEEDRKRAEQRAASIDKVVKAIENETAAMMASEKEKFVMLRLQAAGADLSEKEAARIREKAEALWELQRAEKEAAERGKAIDKQLADEQKANDDARKQSSESLHQSELKMFAEGIRLREEMRTPLEAYAARIEHLSELMEKGAVDEETYYRAQGKAFEDFQEAEDKTAEKAGKLTEVFEAMGQRTARTLGDMAFGLGKNEDVLQSVLNLFQTMGSDFLSGVIAQQGTMPAFKEAGSWLEGAFSSGGFMSGIFHDGGIVGGARSWRRTPASLFANAPRFHDGGVLGAGEMPMIGKVGEEMLTEDDPRHVRNGGRNGAPAVRMGDIIIDARGADAGVEQRLAMWAETIRRQALADVENALRQGGSMSRAARLRS